jgi:phosphate-selective porin OprO/OprP
MFSLGGYTTGGRIDTSGVSIDNLYIRYRGFEDYVVTAGQHTEPFSLEELTSRLNITFMERALNNAFAPGSTVGLSVVTGGQWWTGRGGFFADSIANEKDQGSQGYGITGNFSGTPIHTGGNILHLGGSYSYRNVDDTSDVIFRSRPESGLTDVRYVNTGTIIGSESLHRFGLESIWISGPWSIQGEYIHTLVE